MRWLSKTCRTLRPRERWRSIVMSTSVCLSVRLSVHEHIPERYVRSLPIFAHVAYGRGSVLRRGVETPFDLEVFFPIYNTLYSIAFATHAKTAEPIEMSLG